MINIEKIEAWFTEKLNEKPLPTADMGRALAELARERQADKAEELAEALHIKLLAANEHREIVSLLHLRAGWKTDKAFRDYAQEVLIKLYGAKPAGRALIKNAGWDTKISTQECLRRYQILLGLKADVLCQDKTWGFGVIQNVDTYYERVTINFDRKRGHELALAYAAETLELIDDDHLLARKHRDPKAMAALVKEDPAEVVRLALRSYGAMNAIIMQEHLCPQVVSEKDWKPFWAAARKGLKEDALVVLPAKRTEPIMLRVKEKTLDDGWFLALSKNRHLQSILDRLEEWKEKYPDAEFSDEQRAIVVDRLAFVVKGASLMDRKLKARAMMLAQLILPNDPTLNPRGYAEKVLASTKFIQTVAELPAKDTKQYLAFLLDLDREATLNTLIRVLPHLDSVTLNETLALLIREGREEATSDTIRKLMLGRDAEVELVSWLCRNLDRVQTWNLCTPVEFATIVLIEMEKGYTGNRLKAQNQIKERFTNRDWIKTVWGGMQVEERKRFFLRVKQSSAWDTMDKRSALGNIIKTFPDLEILMSERQDTQKRTSYTSHRSYQERQRQLEKIKTVDIPQNSKDIGHARSYGDLRENFEYKAAKEMQGILMRRQAELEQMLSVTVPTVFDSQVPDKIGMGTGVLIEHPDGHRDTYFILGAWDRDETLGIISSESKLAQALEGKAAGDTVPIPGEHGESTCRIIEVLPLSEPVLQWLAVDEAEPAESVSASPNAAS